MKRSSSALRQAWQRGVILPVTLIILVAMTLAGIALMRSVDTSSIIAGNLAFRQSATLSADAGIEQAIVWLQGNVPSLVADAGSEGYYATRQDTLDLTGNRTPSSWDNLDWSDSSAVKKLAKDSAGNEVSYVIHRMCDAAGPLDPATCATAMAQRDDSSRGSSRQMLTYHPGAWDEVASHGYYRITARVTGPRNTTSFVQAVVII